MLKIKRYNKNPILSPNPDVPWMSELTMNPGVVFDGDRFRMLFTAGANDGFFRLGYAESNNGFDFKIRTDTPFLEPSKNSEDYDFGTIDDPRITYLDGKYYIVHAARSLNMHDYASGNYRVGPNGKRFPTWRNNYRRLGVSVTTDWKTVKRLGPVSSEHLCDANGVLFPEKVNNKYVWLHRPTSATPWLLPMRYNPGCMWILFSDEVDHWSSDRREMPWDMVDGVDIPDDYLLISPEKAWEEFKVGALGVPIITDDGFLVFYHGVDRVGTYRIGLLLLDRNDPRRVLCRTPEPIMVPETKMELLGTYPGCIFPSANVVVGDEIFLYYGAGDHYCCLANLSLKAALEHVKKYTGNRTEINSSSYK